MRLTRVHLPPQLVVHPLNFLFEIQQTNKAHEWMRHRTNTSRSWWGGGRKKIYERVENELKITSFIDITNTKWTVHVHYINSLIVGSRLFVRLRSGDLLIEIWLENINVFDISTIKNNVRDIVIARVSFDVAPSHSDTMEKNRKIEQLKSNAMCKLSNELIYSMNDIDDGSSTFLIWKIYLVLLGSVRGNLHVTNFVWHEIS